MKILLADELPKGCAEELTALGHTVITYVEGNGKKLAGLISECDIVVSGPETTIDRNLIDCGKNLKVIIRGGAGVENIDVQYANGKGIQVMNTPDAPTVSVAELVMGSILNLARGISTADASLKKGVWDAGRVAGFELSGKTLGIIGFGRIGREVAKRALAFNMKVMACDKFLERSPVEKVPIVRLDDILSGSDIISLHIAMNTNDRSVITDAEFERMKSGVVIVNCAKGGAVDEKALLKYIENGKVKGAALDVFEREPTDNNALINHPAVVATPHIGALTAEAQERIGAQVVKIVTGISQK